MVKKTFLCGLIFLTFALDASFSYATDVADLSDKTRKQKIQTEPDGFYTRFDVAYAKAEGQFDRGYVLRTGFGKKYTDHLRGEFSLSRHRHDLKGIRQVDNIRGETNGRISSLTAMVNGYVDLFEWKGFSPYVGIGAGVSRNKMTNVGLYPIVLKGLTKYRLAWQAIGGIGIELPKNLILDIGYSYVNLGDFQTKKTYDYVIPIAYSARKEDVRSHEFHIGLRYNF